MDQLVDLSEVQALWEDLTWEQEAPEAPEDLTLEGLEHLEDLVWE